MSLSLVPLKIYRTEGTVERNMCRGSNDLSLVWCESYEKGLQAQHLIPSATLRRFINSKASRRSCIIMPPKRRAIGRSTPQARKRRALRASESDEQRALRLENLRVHSTETRSSESSDQREVRLETDRIRTNQIRSSETTELRKEGCKMFE
ncbi:hypothetical protein TNCV_2220521 [Trichonephila clavipes]|nr:hypothetical protein TNCV_2220521 [Trichonephila clavipes]